MSLPVFCEARVALFELVQLVRLLACAVGMWWSEAKERAALRAHSAPNRVCPWCGHRQPARQQAHREIEVLVPGRHYTRGRVKALVCSSCGEWWFNTCEHARVIECDDIFSDFGGTCRDCGELLPWTKHP